MFSPRKVGASPKNQQSQDRERDFAGEFSPKGNGTEIEAAPVLKGDTDTPRFQSTAERTTGGFGERNSSSQSKVGEVQLRDPGGKLRIGMQELSFIKKEAGNPSDFFIDSFLNDKDLQTAYNIEYDGVMRNALDDPLAKNLIDNNGFKDVDTEEFDLEDSAPLIDDSSNLEVLKKISEATRKAASSITRPDSVIPPNEMV